MGPIFFRHCTLGLNSQGLAVSTKKTYQDQLFWRHDWKNFLNYWSYMYLRDISVYQTATCVSKTYARTQNVSCYPLLGQKRCCFVSTNFRSPHRTCSHPLCPANAQRGLFRFLFDDPLASDTSPLLQRTDGKPQSYSWFLSRLGKILSEEGITGQSFRRGGAACMWAFQQGLQDELIQELVFGRATHIYYPTWTKNLQICTGLVEDYLSAFS